MSVPATPSPASFRPRRPASVIAAALCLATALAGCQALGGALGGGGGVMPATEVGPPPSLRGNLPGRAARTANVDADGQPLQTAPTRSLDLPKDKRNAARAGSDGSRRIGRDEIEGETASRSGSSGMTPALTPGGSVGLGGKF
ncbi:hypothetical protein [uncultured Methylobacterium sp.]|uniref:hypothetical protein n=1 Tax=uncultured Methylobacterium sp. TaxID=157278 RepID=UPI0035CC2CB8